MATLEELVVKLEADNAKLISALDESAKVTARSSKMMEDSIAKFTEASTKNTNKFGDVMTVFAGTTLANLAVKGAALASEAFGHLKDKLFEGIGEAIQFEQEMTRLANSMAMNGTFTEKGAKALEDYIGKMETLSGVDDEVIAKNLALLSSTTQMTEKGLMRAQTAALNLSATLGIDLESATQMIIKASEGSTAAFRKKGIVIEETASKAGTYEKVLKTLEDRMTGAAAGSMKTFAGAMKSADNAAGNFFQALGNVIVKNPAVVAVINELTKALNSLVRGAESNGASWARTMGEMMTTTLNVFATISSVIEKVINGLVVSFKALVTAGTAVVDTFQALMDLKSGNFESIAGTFSTTKNAFEDMTKSMETGDGKLTSLLSDMAQASAGATTTMGDSFKEVAPNVDAHAEKIRKLTEMEQARSDAAKAMAQELIKGSVDIQGAYTMQQDALQSSLDNQLISFESFKAAKIQSQIDLFEQENALLEKAGLTGAEKRAAEIQLEMQHNATRQKLMDDMRKKEEENSKAKLQGVSTFFGGMAALAQSGNAQIAGIGKAAAVSQATVDAYLAIQNALANVPYPFNIAAAAGIGVQAFANVAKISGVGLKGGIDSIPGVGSGDSFPAMLAPGERVVPSESNKDLTEFLARQGESQASPTFNLNFYGPVWGDKASAGAEIVEAINEALARGMSLRILST